MGKSLCDSGASINLMPLSVVKILSLGELTPTAMTLQMADRTLAHPMGIIEDVFIKVGKFIFLVDFVLIDIEEDKQVSLLLGRPFLATGAAFINVKKGELTLRVGDEAVHFNLNHNLKRPEFIFSTPFPTQPDWRIQTESELLAEFIYQNIYKNKTIV